MGKFFFLLYCTATRASKHIYDLLLRSYFLWAPWVHHQLHSVKTQQLAVRWEAAQGWRETHKMGATVASASILGPEWMMSPPVAVESRVMNHP